MQGTNTNGGSSYGSLPDKIVFYASVFVYRPELKKDFMNFTPSLLSYECKYLRLKRSISKASVCVLTLPIESNIFPKGSNDKLQEFLRMNDDQQRKAIADVN